MSCFVPYVSSINEHTSRMAGTTQDNARKQRQPTGSNPGDTLWLGKVRVTRCHLLPLALVPTDGKLSIVSSPSPRPYTPESAIKNNMLLRKEAAMEQKEKMKRDGCSAWQRVK